MGAMADPHPAPSSARSGLDGMFSTLRGFGVRRNTDDRWLAGVCSGVADRLGIDPLIVRGALIVLLFVGGLGGLVYLIAWALLPDQNGKILAEAALHGDGWGIALLIVIGIALISNISDRWWLWTILVPVGLLVWWALHSARQGKTAEQMGEEAREFGNKFAATFSRPPVATPNDVVPTSETEPPPMSATTSTTPAAPTAPPPPSARRLPRSAAHRRPRRRGVRPRPVVCGAIRLRGVSRGAGGRVRGRWGRARPARRRPDRPPRRLHRVPRHAGGAGHRRRHLIARDAQRRLRRAAVVGRVAAGRRLQPDRRGRAAQPRRSSAGQHDPRRDGRRTAEGLRAQGHHRDVRTDRQGRPGGRPPSRRHRQGGAGRGRQRERAADHRRQRPHRPHRRHRHGRRRARHHRGVLMSDQKPDTPQDADLTSSIPTSSIPTSSIPTSSTQHLPAHEPGTTAWTTWVPASEQHHAPAPSWSPPPDGTPWTPPPLPESTEA